LVIIGCPGSPALMVFAGGSGSGTTKDCGDRRSHAPLAARVDRSARTAVRGHWLSLAHAK